MSSSSSSKMINILFENEPMIIMMALKGQSIERFSYDNEKLKFFFLLVSTWWCTGYSSIGNEIVEWSGYRKSVSQCWEHDWWWKNGQRYFTTVLHFISYLFYLSLFAYTSNSSNFLFLLSYTLALFSSSIFLSHLFPSLLLFWL